MRCRNVGGWMAVALFAVAAALFPTKDVFAKKYKIYLSLSYSGNVWQSAAANEVKALAATPPYNKMVELHEVISGTSAQAQISDYQSMIANGANGIISFPVSPTALNRVIARGCHRGVLFFMYDATVTEPCAYNVSYITSGFGENTAQYLVNLLHGKGKVMINRGVPGNTVDQRHELGMMAVFNRYPGIKVVDEYYGYWDDAKSRQATAQALAAHPDVDGIASQLGEYGVLEAVLDARTGNKKLPFITGEDTNGIRLAFINKKYHDRGLKGVSSGSPPATAGYAFKLMMEVLQGKMKLAHRDIQYPLPWVPWNKVKVCKGEQFVNGCNAFPSDKVAPTWTDAVLNQKLLPEITLTAARTGKPAPGKTIQPLPPIGQDGVVYARQEPNINCDPHREKCVKATYETTKVKPIPVPSQ